MPGDARAYQHSAKARLATLRRMLARRDAEVQRLKDKLAEAREELRRAKRIAKMLISEETP